MDEETLFIAALAEILRRLNAPHFPIGNPASKLAVATQDSPRVWYITGDAERRGLAWRISVTQAGWHRHGVNELHRLCPR